MRLTRPVRRVGRSRYARIALAATLALALVAGVSYVQTAEAEARASAERIENPLPEDTTILVGTQYGLGSYGGIVAYAPNGTERWRFTSGSYFDVEFIGEDRILATYVQREVELAPLCGDYPTPCTVTGVRILNVSGDDPRIEWEINYPVRTLHGSEIHDADYIPATNEIVVVDMEYERVFTVDVATKEETWRFDLDRVYERPAKDVTRVDWLHANDVDVIGPDTYLVSVRNAHQLLVIERGAGVQHVVNADQDRRVIHEQHNPQVLGPNRLLVADSENDRVVELERRERGPVAEWVPVWSLRRAGGRAFEWPRDADRLPNGLTLITDTDNDRVLLVDREGRVAMEIDTPPAPYEADIGREYPAGEPYRNGSLATGGDMPIREVEFLYQAVKFRYRVPAWVSVWVFASALGWALVLVGCVLGWAVGRVRPGGDGGESARDRWIDGRDDRLSD